MRVERIWTVVVLPAPFGPRSEKIVPRGTCRSMPSRTTLSPYVLRRPVASMAGVPVVPVAPVAVGVVGFMAQSVPGGGFRAASRRFQQGGRAETRSDSRNTSGLDSPSNGPRDRGHRADGLCQTRRVFGVLIRIDSVTKRYPDGTVAVDNLSLDIPDRSITVFVGPSGCGKTTTLRMINRMIDPTEGRILLDGKDITREPVNTLRRSMGYVIQNAGLFQHRTILDNIATVPRMLGWGKEKARTRARELMERVGLDGSLAKRYPYQLSGGQQQRVGVARALAADPPVLLMDEPFSAVDPVVRASLQDEFLRLQSELNKTIVFVTHDIDESVKLGHRIAVFAKGGTVAQYATPDELLARPEPGFVTDFLGGERGLKKLRFFQELDSVSGV